MSDPRRHMRIDGSLTVNGDVVFGDQFHNNVGGNAEVIVPIVENAPARTGWQAGADVHVGGHIYLLHEPHLSERFSPDGSVVCRQGRALQHEPRPASHEDPRYVWLRQIAVLADTPPARRAVRALLAEGELVKGLASISGVPRMRSAETEPGGRRATLVLTWPRSRAAQTPCPALDTMAWGGGEQVSPERMIRFFGALAELCSTLAALHSRGRAHRSLTPAGILVLDKGRLALRDLGLAAREPETGEGPVEYQAPEQQWSHEKLRPGPHTDVYQLAALVGHLLTGRLPGARTPVQNVPAELGRRLDAALDPDPAARPDIRSLGAAFRHAHRHLSRGSNDVSTSTPAQRHRPRPK